MSCQLIENNGKIILTDFVAVTDAFPGDPASNCIHPGTKIPICGGLFSPNMQSGWLMQSDGKAAAYSLTGCTTTANSITCENYTALFSSNTRGLGLATTFTQAGELLVTGDSNENVLNLYPAKTSNGVFCAQNDGSIALYSSLDLSSTPLWTVSQPAPRLKRDAQAAPPPIPIGAMGFNSSTTTTSTTTLGNSNSGPQVPQVPNAGLLFGSASATPSPITTASSYSTESTSNSTSPGFPERANIWFRSHSTAVEIAGAVITGVVILGLVFACVSCIQRTRSKRIIRAKYAEDEIPVYNQISRIKKWDELESATYIPYIEPEEERSSAVGSFTVASRDNLQRVETGSSSSSNRSRPPRTFVGVATTIYAFEGGQDGDLAFEAGESLQVLHKHPSGWWRGKIGSREGMFPSTYIREG